MTTARPLAVFDVDGVLADVRHRLHHLERRPKNWVAFFAECAGDAPLPDGVRLAVETAEASDVVYLTGRPEWIREATEAWLLRHGLPPGPVYMRPAGERRPARIVKPSLLRRLARGRKVTLVVDDDPLVCDAFERDGWPVRRADWMERTPEVGQVLDDAQEREGRT